MAQSTERVRHECWLEGDVGKLAPIYLLITLSILKSHYSAAFTDLFLLHPHIPLHMPEISRGDMLYMLQNLRFLVLWLIADKCHISVK